MAVVAEVPTPGQLEARLAEICGHLNVLHAELVSITRRAVDSGLWEGAGIHSPAHWLAWQAGLSPERARQVVQMAERMADLPVSFAAFENGLLAVDQMAVVARRTPAHNDAEVCQLARSATVTQLRSVLNKRFLDLDDPAPQPDGTEPDGTEPDDTTESAAGSVASRPGVGCGFDDDGNYVLHALVGPDDGAIIDTALREVKDALFRAGDTNATWLDALVAVCARSLGAVSTPSRRDLYKILIHVDTEGAWLHRGPALPPTVMDLVLCDGVVQPVWHTEGLPVNVGRRRRIVPAHTRLLVEDRDRVCRNPICASTHNLEVHHIVHWHGDDHGRTDTANLCGLCPRCHRDHHRGEFTITGNADLPDGLEFRDRRGRLTLPCGRPTPPGDDPPPTPPAPYQHPLGERLHAKWLWFRPRPRNDPDVN